MKTNFNWGCNAIECRMNEQVKYVSQKINDVRKQEYVVTQKKCVFEK